MSQRVAGAVHLPIEDLTDEGMVDPIAAVLHRVAGLPDLGALASSIAPAGVVCTRNWRQATAQLPADLSEGHSFFSPLRFMMKELGAVAGLNPSDQKDVQALCRHYQEFIGEVCASEQTKRCELLTGRARLYGSHTVFLISAERARQILGIDLQGAPERDDQHEIVLQTQVGSTIVDRMGERSLCPATSMVCSHLADRLFRGGAVQREVFKIADVWVEEPREEASTESWTFRQLMAAAGQMLGALSRSNSSISNRREDQLIVASPSAGLLSLRTQLTNNSEVPLSGYSAALLLNLLLGGGYGSSDNFCLNRDKMLVAADTSDALKPPVEVRDEGLVLNLRTILPLLSLRNEPIDRKVVKQLTRLPSHKVIVGWLGAVDKKNSDLARGLKEGALTQEDLDKLSLPIRLPLSVVTRVYDNLCSITHLCKANAEITHWELFSRRHPAIAELYDRMLTEARGNPVEAERRLFPELGYLRLDSILPKDDPLYERLAAVASKPVRERPLTPIHAAQQWIGSLSLQTYQADEQVKILDDICYELAGIKTLSLDISIDDQALEKVLSHAHDLEQLIVRQGPLLTANGLIGILNKKPKLSLTLGSCFLLGVDDLVRVIRFAWRQNQSINLLLGDETFPVVNEQKELNKRLWQCVEHETFTYAKGLVALGAEWTCQDSRGQSLLHLAAATPNEAPLLFLLDLNLIDLEGRNSRGETPLYCAAKHGPVSAITILLRRGANIEASDNNGFVPLHATAMRRDELAAEAVTVMLHEGANPRVVSKDQQTTVLHMAAQCSNLAVAEAIRQKLEPDDFKQLMEMGDSDGKRPLHVAARQCKTADLVRFFAQHGADVNALNHFNYTPAHWAAMQGQKESFQCLVEHGARLNITNVNGHQPFDLALRYGKDEIVEAYVDPTFSSRLPLPKLRRGDPAYLDELEPKLIDQLKSAHRRGARLDQILILLKLNNLQILRATSCDRQERSKMMAFYPHAVRIAATAAHLAAQNRDEVPELVHDYLLAKLEGIEGGFLHEALGIKTPADRRAYLHRHRQELARIREEASDLVTQGADGDAVCLHYTNGYKGLLVKLIAETITAIGEPPVPFCVAGLGSMARDEMCRNSDLEFLLVMQERNPEADAYFEKFLRLLELKIIGMGETPCGLFSAVSPPEGFALDGSLTPLKRPDLLGTAAEIARALERMKDDVILGAAVAATTPIYASEGRGDRVYKNFLSQSKKALRSGESVIWGSTNRKAKAETLLLMDVPDFRKQSPEALQGLPGVDIKVVLSRPIQQIASSLAIYFDLKSPTTIGRLEELKRKLPLDGDIGQNLVDAYRYILSLRNQMHLHYQDERNYAFCSSNPKMTEASSHPFVVTPEQITQLEEVLGSAKLFLAKVEDLLGISGPSAVVVDRPAKAVQPVAVHESAVEQKRETIAREASFLYNLGTDITGFDSEQGLRILRAAADAGSAEARLFLGHRLLFEPDGVSDGIRFLELAVEQRLPAAQDVLGVCRLIGHGVERDVLAAVKLFEASAAANHPSGVFNHGLCLMSGFGVRPDRAKGAEMIRRAFVLDEAKPQLRAQLEEGEASQDPRLMCDYAVCLMEGIGGLKADPARAVALFARSAQTGYGPALYHHGYCAYHGVGMSADADLAVSLAQQAVEVEGMTFLLPAQVRSGLAWAAYETAAERSSASRRPESLSTAVEACRKSEGSGPSSIFSSTKTVAPRIVGQVGIEREGMTCWMISLFQAIEGIPLVRQAVQHPVSLGLLFEEREGLRVGLCEMLGAYELSRQEGQTLAAEVVEQFLGVAETFCRATGVGSIPWRTSTGEVDTFDPSEFFEILNHPDTGLGFSRLPVTENFFVRTPELLRLLPLLEESRFEANPLAGALRRLIFAQQAAYHAKDLAPIEESSAHFFRALEKQARECERDQVESLIATQQTGEARRAGVILAVTILGLGQEALDHAKGLVVDPPVRYSILRDLNTLSAMKPDPTLADVVRNSPIALDVARSEEKPPLVFLRLCKMPGVTLSAFTDTVELGDTQYTVQSLISRRGAAHYVAYKRVDDGAWVLVDDHRVSQKTSCEVEMEASRGAVCLLCERV